MKTQTLWLWLWVEEAELTLTSVRNVPGRFPLHGLLLFLQPDLSWVQLVNTLIVLLSKWPPSVFRPVENKTSFDVIWNFTQQCRMIWFESDAVWQCGPVLPSSPPPLSVLSITSPRRTMAAFVSPCGEDFGLHGVWAVCVHPTCLSVNAFQV